MRACSSALLLPIAGTKLMFSTRAESGSLRELLSLPSCRGRMTLVSVDKLTMWGVGQQ